MDADQREVAEDEAEAVALALDELLKDAVGALAGRALIVRILYERGEGVIRPEDPVGLGDRLQELVGLAIVAMPWDGYFPPCKSSRASSKPSTPGFSLMGDT